MGAINKKCQVPTPNEVIVQMLDRIGYKYTEDIIGKRILENSCGSGGFLCEIVRRYIKACIEHEYSKEYIKNGLQRDIHGFEKDRRLHKVCIQNLNHIAGEYGIVGVHWNIKRKNALQRLSKGKYQFVVGNPPYLAYPDLDKSTRKFLKSHFLSCKKGKPDYYFAFIELALSALSPDGQLIYLVPVNFTKNRYSADLRRLLLPSLHEIVDYSHHKLFKNVLTSSVIIYCNQGQETNTVRYEDRHYNRTYIVPKDNMTDKWAFGQQYLQDHLQFSDWFHASAPVATQLNKAFVIDGWDDFDEKYISVSGTRVERLLLRNAAGPKALHLGLSEQIIFPYRYKANNRLVHYTEEEFKSIFPEGYKYLLQYKTDLEQRKADKQALWFEYGRSQLLMHLNQEKLLISTFITGAPRTYILDAQTVPYAGICITARQGHTIHEAQRILNSGAFMEYVRSVGVCTNGVSYRISPTDINSFLFSRELLEE